MNTTTTTTNRNSDIGRFAVAAVSLAAALACGTAAAQSTLATGVEAAYTPGRILIMPRAGLPEQALAKILNDQGGGKARRVGKSELRIVDLPPGREKQMVERLSRHPHIKFAELDMLVEPSLAVNDPYLGSEWHVNKIGAPQAWDTTLGSTVTIAILDTGVDAAHPDLRNSIVPGWNYYSNTSDTSDVFGHGTSVAGSAAAAANNAVGVAGVAGGAKIMPIKISDDSGRGSWVAMANGLTHAADRGVRVANISYAVGGSSSVLSAAQYFKNKGGLVFVSAGNTGAESPAPQTTAVVVVGATDSVDNKASWSTFGAYVSLSAPGVGIYTTAKGGGYGSVNGTSFASPVAAGAAALVFAANSRLTATQAEDILFKSAVDLGSAGRDPSFGFGRVDAAKAVSQAAAASTLTSDTQPPAAAVISPSASSNVSGIATVDVSATDNVGVAKAELFVNGSLHASDGVAPFGFSWDTTKLPNGMATLEVRASDAAGNIGRSQPVTVNVANTVVVDTTAPVAALSFPNNAASTTGSVDVVATATDNMPVSGLSMSLSLDGRVVATASGTGSLLYKWNTRRLKSGTYTFTVVARDASGNVGRSSVSVVR